MKRNSILGCLCLISALLLVAIVFPQSAYGDDMVTIISKDAKNIYYPGGEIDTIIIAENNTGVFSVDEVIEIILPPGYSWNDEDVNAVDGVWSFAGMNYEWAIDPIDKEILKIFVGENTSIDGPGRINVGSDTGGYFAIDIAEDASIGAVFATVYSDRGAIPGTEILIALHDSAEIATWGDLNGDGRVNAGDAILVLLYDGGLIYLTDNQHIVADVNGDGQIDFDDAAMILRHYAGLIGSFPTEGTAITPISGYINRNAPEDIVLLLTWGTATGLEGVYAELPQFGLQLDPLEGINYFINDYDDGTGTITVKGGLGDLLPVPISIVPEGAVFVITFIFDNGKELHYTYMLTD